MNPFFRTTKFLLIAWLCLFSLFNFKTFTGFVICLGQDGHIEVEHAVNDRCTAQGPTSQNDILEINSMEEDHCGDCSDIPLFSATGVQTQYRVIATAETDLNWMSTHVLVQSFQYPIQTFTKPHLFTPPAQSQVMTSIRSVRILV